jgi:hypothetical protein
MSYGVNRRGPDKLAEIGGAFRELIPHFDPKKQRYELEYVTKALECPELADACDTARAALGWPLQRQQEISNSRA